MSIYLGEKLYAGAFASGGVENEGGNDNTDNGGGTSVIVYKKPTSVPVKSGMQIVFYSAGDETFTLKLGNATVNYIVPNGGCKWLLWVQTGETGGSLIEPSGERTYLDAVGTVSLIGISTATANPNVVITIG